MAAGDAPNPLMRLVVNGIYPDHEPITALSPALLAGIFRRCQSRWHTRAVGRTLILVDVKSRLIVDVARRILARHHRTGDTYATSWRSLTGFCWPLSRWFCPGSVRLISRSAPGEFGRLGRDRRYATGEQPQIDVAQQMVKWRAVFPFEFVSPWATTIYTGASRPISTRTSPCLQAASGRRRAVLRLAGNHDRQTSGSTSPHMNGRPTTRTRSATYASLRLDSNYMDRESRRGIETQRGSRQWDWRSVTSIIPLYSWTVHVGHRSRKVLKPLFVNTAWMSCRRP